MKCDDSSAFQVRRLFYHIKVSLETEMRCIPTEVHEFPTEPNWSLMKENADSRDPADLTFPRMSDLLLSR